MASSSSLKWISFNLAVVLTMAVLMASASPLYIHRSNSQTGSSLKPNSWIIQSPKKPAIGFPGIGLPPGGMLLMTVDPNATDVENVEPIRPVGVPLQQLQEEDTGIKTTPATTSTTTELPAPTTSEPPVTQVFAVSMSPIESANLSEDVIMTSPSVEDEVVTETLSTSTVGTESVTEALSSTTTREPDVVVTQSSTEIEPSSSSSAPVTSAVVEDDSSESDNLTTEAAELTTTTEESSNSTDSGESSGDSEEDHSTTESGNTTEDDGSGAGGIVANTSLLIAPASDDGEASGDDSNESSGSGDHSGGGPTVIPLLNVNEELDVEAGSTTDPDDGSDAPPDVPAALSDDSVKQETESSTDVEILPTESAVESESAAQFLVHTTEPVPEDPGLGESTTDNPDSSKQSPSVELKSITGTEEGQVAKSRHLLSADSNELDSAKEADEDKDVDEEARQYRPYADRPGRRPAARPGRRPTIDRHDQDYRPDYDTYNDDAGVLYRTYDYCYTLWCKFKTSLHRVGLL